MGIQSGVSDKRFVQIDTRFVQLTKALTVDIFLSHHESLGQPDLSPPLVVGAERLEELPLRPRLNTRFQAGVLRIKAQLLTVIHAV